MENKKEYLDRLQMAVQHLHKCGAHWLRSELVHEWFRGKTVWQGEVEVFGLIGHPEAKRAYAWYHREGPNDQGERFVAMLEILPVDSARRAVQVQIEKDVKRQNGPKNKPPREAS